MSSDESKKVVAMLERDESPAQNCCLRGKPFYCREWVFTKLSHYLSSRARYGKTSGVLIVGGPGAGKTAVCAELVWPTTVIAPQSALNSRLLAYHFCQYQEAESLSVAVFIRSIAAQLAASPLISGFKELIETDSVALWLDPIQCQRYPTTAFENGVIKPLNSIKPPSEPVFIIVDSLHEAYMTADMTTHCGISVGSSAIFDLLSAHYHLLPNWLLLVCTARRQCRSVTRLFTGFRKIGLDDLKKSSVVRDVQQYILHRLDDDDALRSHLNLDTAEMLNQLHIKSNGCILYLEKVLDGIVDSFIGLREIREIPGTLNGLFLWLSQRLFTRRQFESVRPILNVMLAAKSPLSLRDVFECCWTRDTSMSEGEFLLKMSFLSKLLLHRMESDRVGENVLLPCILFHNSYAEWLLDVKYCTLKYICDVADGCRSLAMWYSAKARDKVRFPLSLVAELAYYVSKIPPEPPMEPFHLPLWLLKTGAPVQDLVVESRGGLIYNEKTTQILLQSGADLVSLDSGASSHSDNNNSGNECEADGTSKEDSPASTSHNPGCSAVDIGLLLDECITDAEGRNALHRYASDGNVTAVKILLAKGYFCDEEDNNGATPLNLAARLGKCDVVAELLEAGADVNHLDKQGWTPLRACAWSGHLNVCRILLEAGADPNFCGEDNRSALRSAAWSGHLEVCAMLIDTGTVEIDKEDAEGRTPLVAAAYMGHKDVVQLLVERGDSDVNHKDKDGRTPLLVAISSASVSGRHCEVVDYLLKEAGAKPNLSDNKGVTPLIAAAIEGHTTVIESLLAHGADVDYVDNSSMSALLYAASLGHLAALKALLAAQADIDSIDQHGGTALSLAAAQGSAEVVAVLLQRGMDELHRDNNGWIPLHHAAFEGHTDACRALCNHGSTTVNEVDSEGRHPLVLACEEGHTDVVRVLLDVGANSNRPCLDGRTALRIAAMEGHRDICDLLISRGADAEYRDLDGRTILYTLVLERRVEMLRFFLTFGLNVDCVDAHGRTPLAAACFHGDSEMAQLLIKYGGNVNATDNDGRSPLFTAVWQGHTNVAHLLLQNRANPNHSCKQGATPLHIAAQEGNLDMCRLLLKFRADPQLADSFGRKASDVAEIAGHPQVAKLLSSDQRTAHLLTAESEQQITTASPSKKTANRQSVYIMDASGIFSTTLSGGSNDTKATTVSNSSSGFCSGDRSADASRSSAVETMTEAGVSKTAECVRQLEKLLYTSVEEIPSTYDSVHPGDDADDIFSDEPLSPKSERNPLAATTSGMSRLSGKDKRHKSAVHRTKSESESQTAAAVESFSRQLLSRQKKQQLSSLQHPPSHLTTVGHFNTQSSTQSRSNYTASSSASNKSSVSSFCCPVSPPLVLWSDEHKCSDCQQPQSPTNCDAKFNLAAGSKSAGRYASVLRAFTPSTDCSPLCSPVSVGEGGEFPFIDTSLDKGIVPGRMKTSRSAQGVSSSTPSTPLVPHRQQLSADKDRCEQLPTYFRRASNTLQSPETGRRSQRKGIITNPKVRQYSPATFTRTFTTSTSDSSVGHHRDSARDFTSLNKETEI